MLGRGTKERYLGILRGEDQFHDGTSTIIGIPRPHFCVFCPQSQSFSLFLLGVSSFVITIKAKKFAIVSTFSSFTFGDLHLGTSWNHHQLHGFLQPKFNMLSPPPFSSEISLKHLAFQHEWLLLPDVLIFEVDLKRSSFEEGNSPKRPGSDEILDGPSSKTNSWKQKTLRPSRDAIKRILINLKGKTWCFRHSQCF